MGKWRSLADVVHELAEKSPEDLSVCLATGLDGLDRVLGGGLRPGLTVLGAGPSRGKSTLALQMALHIKSPETPVLFYSMEMPADQLAYKVISYQAFAAGVKEKGFPGKPADAGEWAFSAQEMLSNRDRAAFSEEKRRRMDAAWAEAGRLFEDLYIIDRHLSAGEIVRDVRAFLAERPKTVPLVIVDYLQMLPKPADKTLSDRQVVEVNLNALVALAHGSDGIDGVPVLLISSLNRGGYDQNIQMEFFKETGGIEYSADLLLGLQFSACRDKRGFDPHAEERRFPRRMEISVLKQRYGGSGMTVPLDYYAEYGYFAPRDHAPSGTANAEDEVPALPASAGETDAPVRTAAARESEAAESPAAGGTASQWEKLKKKGPKAYMGIAYVSNVLRKGRVRPGEWVECPVAKGDDGASVVTRFRLTAEVTSFDMCVADAVYSLYKDGKKGFSLGGLLHALSGDDRQTATKQWKELLTESVGRLTAAEIAIECAEEHKRRSVNGPGMKDAYSGPFLAAGPEGKDRWRFTGQEAPLPLYQYEEQIHQIIRFPLPLMAVEKPDGGKLRDSAENIQIKRFLIRRVEVVRNGKAKRYRMNAVRYLSSGEGLFYELGLDPEGGRAEFRRRYLAAHETVKTVLDHFRRIGYIRGWSLMDEKDGLPGGVEFDI